MINKSHRNFPILYSIKEECCGCTACYTVCTKLAISMEADKNGFDYPVLNKNKCIKCLKVCPIKNISRL